MGRNPRTWGLVGSETSTKEDPSAQPTMAYSLPVSGSVQPQMSLPSPLLPRSLRDTNDRRSTSLHSYSPAIPLVQGMGPEDCTTKGQRCSCTQMAWSFNFRSITNGMRQNRSAERHGRAGFHTEGSPGMKQMS